MPDRWRIDLGILAVFLAVLCFWAICRASREAEPAPVLIPVETPMQSQPAEPTAGPAKLQAWPYQPDWLHAAQACPMSPDTRRRKDER